MFLNTAVTNMNSDCFDNLGNLSNPKEDKIETSNLIPI